MYIQRAYVLSSFSMHRAHERFVGGVQERFVGVFGVRILL